MLLSFMNPEQKQKQNKLAYFLNAEQQVITLYRDCIKWAKLFFPPKYKAGRVCSYTHAIRQDIFDVEHLIIIFRILRDVTESDHN